MPFAPVAPARALLRLPTPGETPTDRPTLTDRPPLDASIAAVIEIPGVCEPPDIIANRLDPWHGAWFHPYAFTRLRVLAEPSDAPGRDRFLVEVAYRFTGRTGVPVRAVFTAPEPRTVAMRIIAGEGASSVVETHACPLAPGPDGQPRTAVVEERGAEHVSVALARGVPWRLVARRHIVRNAMLPVTTIVGVNVAALIAGATVVEHAFTLDGVGALLINAVQQKDFPVVQAVALLLVAVFGVVNLVIDVLYAVIDPRVQLGGERA